VVLARPYKIRRKLRLRSRQAHSAKALIVAPVPHAKLPFDDRKLFSISVLVDISLIVQVKNRSHGSKIVLKDLQGPSKT